MRTVLVKEISKYQKKKVKINGWVYNSRRSGKIGFLMLRDGSGIIQCIIEKSHIKENNFEKFKTFTQESSVSIIGEVVKNEEEHYKYCYYYHTYYFPNHLSEGPQVLKPTHRIIIIHTNHITLSI